MLLDRVWPVSAAGDGRFAARNRAPSLVASLLLKVLGTLRSSGTRVWLDGGWGVDALVGRQTRAHDDVDLALALHDVDRATEALAALGFDVYIDEMPTRLVLRSAAGAQIDLHPLTFDENGSGKQALPGGGFGTYDAAGLSGIGYLGGQRVPCLTAALQMRFHKGYPLREKDRHDLRLLEGLMGPQKL